MHTTRHTQLIPLSYYKHIVTTYSVVKLLQCQATFTTYCSEGTFKASISKRITTGTQELTSRLQTSQIMNFTLVHFLQFHQQGLIPHHNFIITRAPKSSYPVSP